MSDAQDSSLGSGQESRQDNQQANNKAMKDSLIDAALSAAAVQPWDQITMIDIAAEADVKLASALEVFEDKSDVWLAYSRRLDRQVAESLGDMGAHESCRDRLFDALMERLELLSDHRRSIESMMDSVLLDPKRVLTACPHLHASMQAMLDLAHIEATGIRGAARLLGLSAVYVRAVYVMLEDDSADLAKVMASLDKDLGRLESLANFVSL